MHVQQQGQLTGSRLATFLGVCRCLQDVAVRPAMPSTNPLPLQRILITLSNIGRDVDEHQLNTGIPDQDPRTAKSPSRTDSLQSDTTTGSPVSAILRSVCLKAQMMELITSCSCCGDKVYSVSKQLLVIALSKLKNCSRCSGKSCREGCSSMADPGPGARNLQLQSTCCTR